MVKFIKPHGQYNVGDVVEHPNADYLVRVGCAVWHEETKLQGTEAGETVIEAEKPETGPEAPEKRELDKPHEPKRKQK